MIFKQLFEPLSNTFTYLIACESSRLALLVDPVVPTIERDLELIASLDLKLHMTLETHIHADHITSALHLRERTGSKIAFPAIDALSCADIQINNQQPVMLGKLSIMPLFTPGHTDDHFSYALDDRVLTGDCLLIDGCGRTDFQNGDSKTLYHSIVEILFALDDATLVYPAHDYNGRCVSTIGQEKNRNPRIASGVTEQEFIKAMKELKLPKPKFIEYAVEGNRLCGECPTDLPEKMQKYCQQMTESLQG